MARLVLGPLLRFVGSEEATVWVELDGPAEVEVRAGEGGGRERSFHASGHYYAVVHVAGLEPGALTAYSVAIDGEPAWPAVGDPWPAPCIATPGPGGEFRLFFGSCRVSAPHVEPYTLSKDEDDRGRGIDALHALALRLRHEPPERWPHLLFLCGDQIYADELSPAAREFIASRRDLGEPPGEEVADFEEYTRLYWEAWGEPVFRWLLSTVASAMIFDDHDVHDDWNTSQAWLDEYRAKPWWADRIDGGFSSYWIYQHIGNLSPPELATNELYARVRAADDAGPLLREFAHRSDRERGGSRWSYSRALGDRGKLVVIDSRAGRVLEPGQRRMVDEEEWDWIQSEARGGVEHLLLGTSLPFLLAPPVHDFEAWNEAVCDGAWGARMARWGEKVRQRLDLEHWAAFGSSFAALAELSRAVGAGERGSAPASIVALSGDVHHAYLSRVGFARGSGVRSAVYQAVCSPVRNPLDRREQRALRAMRSGVVGALMRLLARGAGVPAPSIRWREEVGPWFENQIASIVLDGPSARLRLERARCTTEPGSHPELELVLDRALTGASA